VKRVLVVANPFPPTASAGNARILRFIRHLPDQGWEPTVLTAEARGTAATPELVRVVRTPALVPRWLLGGSRRSTRVNDWLFVPDASAPWVPAAVAAGRRLLADERFDAILSSHPRASTHVVASHLTRATGVPWLADYRDRRFANEVRVYATRAHASANLRLEAHVLRHAAGLTAINQPILDALVAYHPWLADRAHVLSNGFDADDAVEPADLGEGFWFVYTGRLYKRERPLEAFLTAFATLPDDVRILFAGDEPRVRPIVERLGIGHRVRLERTVSHAQALGLQRAADAVLLVTQQRPESMSSKVFEYLSSGRPLFAVSEPHTAAGKLLAEVGGAVLVSHAASMREPLADFVAAVREGRGPAIDAAALARYDARNLTAELTGLLDSLSPPGGTRR
jgi:hypothetical protein